MSAEKQATKNAAKNTYAYLDDHYENESDSLDDDDNNEVEDDSALEDENDDNVDDEADDDEEELKFSSERCYSIQVCALH